MEQSIQELYQDMNRQDDETLKVMSQAFYQNQQLLRKSGETSERRLGESEMKVSQEFWHLNKQKEGEIDQYLRQLQQLDNQIIELTEQVRQLNTIMDDLDDRIRDILIHKTPDSMYKAEPLFQQKQQLQERLDALLKSQNRYKDEKVQGIKKIIKVLLVLKQTREQRLSSISNLISEEGNHEELVESVANVLFKCFYIVKKIALSVLIEIERVGEV